MKNKLVAISAFITLMFVVNIFHKGESYFRKRTVKLVSSHGSCSGEQIHAPSGTDYILTAAHCRILAEDDVNITVITDSGKKLNRRIVAEDVNSDLLLLEGLPGVTGLSIANSLDKRDSVYTFTHGHGFDTYKTQGTIIDYSLVTILMEERLCTYSMPKYKMVSTEPLPGLVVDVCTMQTNDSVTDAFISPGSSGGMVVNVWGNLVGVVSAGGGGFGYLVSLSDIHNFVDAY